MRFVIDAQATDSLSRILPHKTREEVLAMAHKSAPCSHHEGNRRYKEYIFRAVGQRIVSVALARVGVFTNPMTDGCPDCHGTLRVSVFEICEECEGEGCCECNLEGGGTIEIPCQKCN